MNIIELLKQIEKRPPMYIGQNSISCLKSFLDGWYFRNTAENVNMEVLTSFNEWIQKMYNLDNRRNWDRIILFYSQDEATALEIFFKYFNQFLAEHDHN